MNRYPISNSKGQGKLLFGFLFFAGLFAILIVLNPVLRDALLPWTAYKAEVTSAEGIIERTYNPDNAIYNYEWFKRQEEKIHATELQIENTIAQRKEFMTTYGNVS